MFDPIAYINTPRWQQSRLGLERIVRLMELLGDPQDSLKFVHVAGTNGKGSTCSYIESVLRTAGFKTGLFTSPYIERFEERIRVCGENIPMDNLRQVTLQVKEKAEAVEAEMGEHPTEFELMTAVALVHFAQQQCDIVVLEVGMGGRLDSTNIIKKPEVSVICRLGLDHTAILGDTIGQIAAEKAGIIKPGCPVVSYQQEEEAAAVIEGIASEKGCSLVVANMADLTVGSVSGLEEDSAMSAMRVFSYGLYEGLTTKLLAAYQPCNAAVAIEAIRALKERGWNISDQDIAVGIANTVWPGRFELLPTTPLSIVDGGHNPQGAKAMADTLEDVLPALRNVGLTGPVVFLVGLLADKDYRSMVATVAPYADAFVASQPKNPRALSAEELAVVMQECNDQALVAVCPDGEEAVRRAKILAQNAGVIVAFGSLYQVGEIKRALLG